MSETEYMADAAEMYRMRSLAPSGQLPTYMGKIQKKQIPPLAAIFTLAWISKKEEELLSDKKRYNSKGEELPQQTVDELVSQAIDVYGRTYLSLTGSDEGFRSKQIAIVSVSSNSPVQTQQPGLMGEKPLSKFDRWILRKKPDNVASTH